jgi:hypothetical protein
MSSHSYKDITRLEGTETLNASQVDIRAFFRRQKLWPYSQQEPVTPEEKLKSEEAADYITPTLSPSGKAKLTDTEFNNAYLLMQKIQEANWSTSEAEFMRLSREYYTLTYNGTSNMSDFLTWSLELGLALVA